MSKHIQWLLSEIDKWMQEGLIDFAQAKAIRGRYPIPAPSVSN